MLFPIMLILSTLVTMGGWGVASKNERAKIVIGFGIASVLACIGVLTKYTKEGSIAALGALTLMMITVTMVATC